MSASPLDWPMIDLPKGLPAPENITFEVDERLNIVTTFTFEGDEVRFFTGPYSMMTTDMWSGGKPSLQNLDTMDRDDLERWAESIHKRVVARAMKRFADSLTPQVVSEVVAEATPGLAAQMLNPDLVELLKETPKGVVFIQGTAAEINQAALLIPHVARQLGRTAISVKPALEERDATDETLIALRETPSRENPVTPEILVLPRLTERHQAWVALEAAAENVLVLIGTDQQTEAGAMESALQFFLPGAADQGNALLQASVQTLTRAL